MLARCNVHPIVELLLDAPAMVVLVLGDDFRIEYFNLLARERVGGRDLTGQRVSDVFPELQLYLRNVASSRHYGGLGLGLWTTRAIVQRMGGDVDVRSELGRGATFTVDLPRRT